MEPDYTKMSYSELIDVREHINAKAYPERYNSLMTEIEARKNQRLKSEEKNSPIELIKSRLTTLKFIYVKFIILCLSFIVFYLSSVYFILSYYQRSPIDNNYLFVWIPFAISYIIVFIFLRQRIHCLYLVGGNGNKPFIFQIVAAFTIFIPVMLGAYDINDYVGDLTKIEYLNEYSNQKPTRYFEVKSAIIDKSKATSAWSVQSSGRHDTTIKLYFIIPFVDKSNSYFNNVAFGAVFSQIFSKNTSDDKRKEIADSLLKSSIEKINNLNFQSPSYFQISEVDDFHDGFKYALASSTIFSGELIPEILTYLDMAPIKNKVKLLSWPLYSFIIACLIFLAMCLATQLKAREYREFKDRKPVDNYSEYLTIFKPQQNFFATPLLIILLCLIFAGMAISGLGFIEFRAQDLLNLGANYGPGIDKGEYWRLVTSIFIHGGIVHLIFNCFGLLLAGIFLESMVGKFNLLLLFILSGIGGSLTSFYWYDSTISVGASGAIMGLWGAVFINNLIPVLTKGTGVSNINQPFLFIVLNLLYGLAGGIDNAAHLGGLGTGVILATLFLFYSKLEHKL